MISITGAQGLVWPITDIHDEVNIMPKESKTKSSNQRLKLQDLGSKTKTLNATEAKKVKGGLAVDPSDPSGNTVYIGGASGGVWKTTNVKPFSK